MRILKYERWSTDTSGHSLNKSNMALLNRLHTSADSLGDDGQITSLGALMIPAGGVGHT